MRKSNGHAIPFQEVTHIPMTRKLIFSLLAAAMVVVLVFVGAMVLQPALAGAAPTPTPLALTTPATDTTATSALSSAPSSAAIAALQGTLENIYTQVSPSVVHIEVTLPAQNQTSSLPQFPGLPFGFQTPPNQQTPQPSGALGSGFVWDKQGHIITNNHVIDGASTITVYFADGTSVPAKVIGADPDSDLAVLQVDAPASELQPVQLANSDQLKVGQLAIAIGNPFGLENTMTVGIISALGRQLPTNQANTLGPTYTIPDVIQTDAPINPGNSGGVLLDASGNVVGVTAAIESPVQANAGIGFAIPAAIVNQVVPALIQTGHFDHAYLGISGTTLTPDLAKAMGLQSTQRGALVIDVTPNGPADKAGVQGSGHQVTLQGQQVRVGGDVIVAIDGQTVNSFDDIVTYLVRHTDVGQKVSLTVLRNNRQQTLDVTLAARPSSTSGSVAGGTSGAWLGVSGIDLTAAIDNALGLQTDAQGVLIQQVQQGSPADDAGLQGGYKPTTIGGNQVLLGGDIIISIDGQPVDSVQTLQSDLAQIQPGQQAVLGVVRNGNAGEVIVTLGQQPSQ